MRVAIAGGHGQIAQLLEKRLADAGHEAIGLIRNPDHAADLLVQGAIPVVIDLESTDAGTLATALAGADALVFAAGAGPSSTAERKLTVDRGGAILLANAAEQAGIRRLVLISAISADEFDAESDDVFQVYLRAKSEADAAIRSRDLDWTIIRPGSLTDDPPTGQVRLASSTARGSIPRADVAALVMSVLVNGTAIRAQFEAVSGEDTVSDALAALTY